MDAGRILPGERIGSSIRHCSQTFDGGSQLRDLPTCGQCVAFELVDVSIQLFDSLPGVKTLGGKNCQLTSVVSDTNAHTIVKVDQSTAESEPKTRCSNERPDRE